MKDVSFWVIVVIAIIALLCVVPFLFIWATNGLLDAAGTGYKITHGFWNYLYAWVLVILLNSKPKQ